MRTVLERFESYFTKTDGCWVWTGSLCNSGYGSFYLNGRHMRPARVALQLYRGVVVPDGMFACHHCDNPACVRPDHIFIGSAKDNSADMYRKGRNPQLVAPDFQRAKTHCPKGHPYSDENTRRRRNSRECRTCTRLRSSRIAAIRKQDRRLKRQATR